MLRGIVTYGGTVFPCLRSDFMALPFRPYSRLLDGLGVCIAGTIAHFLLNYSMRQLPATLGSLVRSSDIFWAYLLEIIVFGERPQAGTWFGVLFVCTSLVMVLLQTTETQTSAKGIPLPSK